MRYGKIRYKRIHNIDGITWRKCIAKTKLNNFELCNIFPIICDINNEEIHTQFNEETN